MQNKNTSIEKIKKNKWKVIFSFIGLMALIGFFVWVNYITEREYKLLHTEGRITTGTTLETHWTKRGTDLKYYFFVDGKKYIGFTKIPQNIWGNIYVKVPDGKFEVTYYPKDPTINSMNLNRQITSK